MLRRLIINTFVTLIATIPLSAPLVAQEQLSARQIVVTGEGQVQAAPDMATLSIGVGHQAPTAAEAMEQVAVTVQQVFTRLTDLGVAPRDVQTTQLRIDPVWRQRNTSTPQEVPEIVGFSAHNDISVRLRDMTRLGEVIGLLVEDGANRLSGISFGVQSPEIHIAEARRLAVVDAQARAALYAKTAGVELGPVLEIAEPGSSQGPGPMFARAEGLAMADGMPVAGGELTFGAQLRMTFAITR
ncbi:SIMPL domain-containing protein [Marinovum sp.]|uniref:SIMPL domain-containing protein n=1 Tax=Marinovum sp. TaxID=2024839 RepID=UPI002B2787F1|nr:SIMPL domain-containing protein [Marinovum sp.]